MKWQDVFKAVVGRELAGFLVRVLYALAGLAAGSAGLPPAGP